MALNLHSSYPTKTAAGDANYPWGYGRNVSSPGAGDGTPWAPDIYNDWLGFFAKLLTDANITPSGNPDTVLVSDYFDAMRELFPTPQNFLDGLEISISSGDTSHDITVAAGSALDSTNGVRMTLASAITKQCDATWVAGTNNGGRIGTDGAGWYAVFLIQHADGTVDVAVEGSADWATAATTLSTTSYTYFRRIGWIYLNASYVIVPFVQDGDYFSSLNPSHVTLGSLSTTAGSTTPTGLPDQGNIIAHVIAHVNNTTSALGSDVYGMLYGTLSPFSGHTPSSGKSQIWLHNGMLADTQYGVCLELPTTSAFIGYVFDTIVANADLYLTVTGWTDHRGKDGNG